MTVRHPQPQILQTTAGDVPLHEYHLHLAGREWNVLHTGVILTHADEVTFLRQSANRLPYGVALWPSAIALAHELAERSEEFAGRSVLELGAGTGLPGIVAASLGGRVVQTDRQELALSVCRRNCERNGVAGIEHRSADWTEWADEHRYDWIIGADILYGATMHPHLQHIFGQNLAPGGGLLLADPFRATSLALFEALQAAGWSVSITRWNLGDEDEPRAVGLFEITPP